jgi:hypothetical protein
MGEDGILGDLGIEEALELERDDVKEMHDMIVFRGSGGVGCQEREVADNI